MINGAFGGAPTAFIFIFTINADPADQKCIAAFRSGSKGRLNRRFSINKNEYVAKKRRVNKNSDTILMMAITDLIPLRIVFNILLMAADRYPKNIFRVRSLIASTSSNITKCIRFRSLSYAGLLQILVPTSR